MTASDPIDPDSVGFALWYAQGGDGMGLVRWDAGQTAYVWHELPGWAESMEDGNPDKPKLGEPIYHEMGLVPANASARIVTDGNF